MSDFIRQHTVTIKSFSAETGWVILNDREAGIKAKIERLGIPLKQWDIQINYGIKTGFNEAFIINAEKRKDLLKKCPKADEIIRPIIRGRDISKFRINFADLWLINTHNGIKEKNIAPVDVRKEYPIIYEHLSKYKEQLKERQDKGDHWTNLRNCAYLEIFSGPKIIYPETMRFHKEDINNFPRFTYDSGDFICDKTIFAITGNNLMWLIAYLNSRITQFLLPKYVSMWDDSGFMLQKVYLENIPILKPDKTSEKRISDLVKKIIDSNSEIERKEKIEEIDMIFFKMLNLNADEIEILKAFLF